MKNNTLQQFFEHLPSKIKGCFLSKNKIYTLDFFKFNERRKVDHLSKFSDLALIKALFIIKNQFKVAPLLVFLIFGMALLMPSQMQAQHPYGFMDGNVNNNDNKLDWENVHTKAGLPVGNISTGIIFDGNAPDSIYSGGGTKDHLPINGTNASKSWQWKTADGSSSDKSNIQEAGAILIDGKIYFFGNRYSGEGTTTIGFWFFQDEVGAIAGNRFSGEHSVGDILIVADIANGGAVGVIDAYKWVGAGNGTLPSNTKSMVKLATSITTLSAIVNAGELTSPWPHQSKGVAAGIMPPITFFEGFIDIANPDLGLVNACFSSFLVETRSSNPVSSVLEDFTFGAFNVQPSVSVDDITICEGDAPGTLTAVPVGGILPLVYEWKKDGNVIPNETAATLAVSESGTYSVTVIGEGIGSVGNCPSDPDTAVVIINPNPAPSVDDEAECVGATATFSTADLGTGFTYQWYKDNIKIDDAESYSYTTDVLTSDDDGKVYKVVVSKTNANCTGEDSGMLTINASPEIKLKITQPTLCGSATGSIEICNPIPGATYSLVGVPNSGIDTDDPGDVIFSGLAAGSNPTVSVVTGAGCTTTSTCNDGDTAACPVIPLPAAKTTDAVAPIEAKTETAGFTTYPVPFKDQLTIRYNFDYKSDVKIEVFDSQGISVLSKADTNSYLNKEVTLDLKLNRGRDQVYVVKVTTNRGSSIKKVISSR
ncbi:T9SS type A sorting domain-containing protein [Flavobacterium yafengii]|uniref:T9SS type A sorting domain-containing protein n=1 Tax=Flavobacterium yafengii TaxID=3041253 RepID=UPI0024A7E5A4|nr:T9SS type A sorting domain-containing protein [Flavobacterium yafengii]MDI5898415.1 T9SS type A sorting domain-containing protein [Flavobacterium yafengii]MDI6047395.1 T9SS type A sorting domain-containing protein [Flavobacterium yafengii]